MKILFLTLLDFDTISERNIYTDLLQEFVNEGHEVTAISPVERRKGKKKEILETDNVTIVKPAIGNIQKTSIIEKGISTVRLESQFIKSMKKYLSNKHFDLVIYSTPPITFYKTVNYVKKRDSAFTFLLLKDIFPQNAVDLGIMQKNGLNGIVYRWFRRKETFLYQISDYIGCMSPANVDYILANNKKIEKRKVGVCPNTCTPSYFELSTKEKRKIREKYRIPQDRIVLVYGGNIGKPQGVEFVIDCIRKCKNLNVCFLIIGEGTEYKKISMFKEKIGAKHLQLIQWLPYEEYERVIAACDVGLIFLANQFTIPNFPSRLLSYMDKSLPVLAATDRATDIGKIITCGDFGWYCSSDDVKSFYHIVCTLTYSELRQKGENARYYLLNNYTSKKAYDIIMRAYYENRCK